MSPADPAPILHWLRLLHPPGALIEARCLAKTAIHNRVGLYDDHERLAVDLAGVDGAANLYTTLQQIRLDLVLTRDGRPLPRNQLHRPGTATRDTDIVRYRWLFVDADPIREPSDRMATDAEAAAAVTYVYWIRERLAAEGWPAPILAASGNGAYCLFHIDLPAAESDLVRRALEGIKRRFLDPAVKVDVSMYNPARIIRAIGTTNLKGTSTPARPWRVANALEVPNGQP
jgi:hypothetical protein